MTRGAARAQPGAEAHQQPGQQHCRPGRVHGRLGEVVQTAHQQRTQDQAQQENQTGADLLAAQQPTKDAADAGDPAVDQQQQADRRTQQQSARQGREIGGEGHAGVSCAWQKIW